MEDKKTLQTILTTLKGLDVKINVLSEGQKEIKEEIRNMDSKLELLTQQTSNAVIEHHGNSISFLKDKVLQLEEELYTLKRS